MPVPASPVVDALQTSHRLHLTAVEHYGTLGEHLARWGYGQLGNRWKRDAEEERGHLRAVEARLEFFDLAPGMQHEAPAWPRHDAVGQLQASLALEIAAAESERAGVLTSRAAGDEGSAVVFAELLAESEASIREIEADLLVIAAVGLDNWLQGQI